MRGCLCVLLLCAGLAATEPATAGPIRVGVEPRGAIEGPVLVSVSGQYVSIHGGNSHHWRDAFIPAGGRHFIALGAVIPLVTVGVSVRIFHPEFVAESAKSSSIPLLLRPVGFETFEPRTWRDIMAKGESRFGERPETPAGHVLPQAYWHLRGFLLGYLPALDEEPGPASRGPVLAAQLVLLEELVRYALEAPAPTLTPPDGTPVENHAAYQTSLRGQDLKYRVEIEDVLHRIREWLSLDRGQRRHVRNLMEQMKHTQRVADQLMTEADRERLGEYLGAVAASRSKGRSYEKGTSWVDPTTRVAYRVRMITPAGTCATLSVSMNLTRVVAADLGEMTNSVKGRFCRDDEGRSRYERS